MIARCRVLRGADGGLDHPFLQAFVGATPMGNDAMYAQTPINPMVWKPFRLVLCLSMG